MLLVLMIFPGTMVVVAVATVWQPVRMAVPKCTGKSHNAMGNSSGAIIRQCTIHV